MYRFSMMYAQKLTHVRFFYLLLGIAVFLTPHSAETKNTAETKKITVYSVIGYANKVGKLFRRKTGIKARVIILNGNGTAFERIRSEKNKPKADVWLGGSIGAHSQAAFEGLSTPFTPSDVNSLDPAFRDPLGNFRVVGLYMGIQSIVVNTQYLKNKGVAIPTCWQDLLDPSYKGMVGMKSPLVSGTAYTTLVQLLGEEDAFGYLAKLNSNLSLYKDSHTRRVSQSHQKNTG